LTRPIPPRPPGLRLMAQRLTAICFAHAADSD
jgi:hypothetical protein